MLKKMQQKGTILCFVLLTVGLYVILSRYVWVINSDTHKMKMYQMDERDRIVQLKYQSESIVQLKYQSESTGKVTVQPIGKHSGKLTGKPKGVYFLKVHKCGSTTLQTILLRYGLLYNMTIGMPCSHPQSVRQIMGIPEPLKSEHIMPLSTGLTHYDLIAQHTRYSIDVKQIMMPGTPFVAILRDPITHFKSLFSFFKVYITYRKHISLPNNATVREKFKYFVDRIKDMPELTISPPDGLPARNPQLYTFGLTDHQTKNLDFVQDSLKQFESDFDLVMLVEHFDESLVLLRNILNCDLRDLISLKSSYVSPDKGATKLTTKQKQNILEWNAGDKILYDHFNKTFWKKVEQYGFDRMSEDVAKLQELARIEKESCHAIGKIIGAFEVGLETQRCKLYNADIWNLERFVRSRMTKSGIYNVSLAQRTCKHPPTLDGQ
ncbi:unnamed protein product [Owenia fusiformis]|uniref:Uncharacterized protein n=1 Tax=Owenia fusiformis TaxID=6347 RepID=A0A8J1Y234_OWEFU|nr:unnamed protein product [Owenia fusiformis]